MPSTAGRFARVVVATVALISVSAGCGGDKSGGPVGTPEDIVTRAPDKTLAAGTAEIIISAPTAAATGVVDLANHRARLSLAAPGSARPAELLVAGEHGYVKIGDTYTRLDAAVPEVLRGGDPWADIDLVRGAVHIRSDGGGEVRGLSTIGYTLTIDPQQAISTTPPARQDALRAVLQGRTAQFQMAVWIDRDLLIRRIEVATSFDFPKATPPTRIDGKTIAADIDFVRFGVPVAPVTPPLPGG